MLKFLLLPILAILASCNPQGGSNVHDEFGNDEIKYSYTLSKVTAVSDNVVADNVDQALVVVFLFDELGFPLSGIRPVIAASDMTSNTTYLGCDKTDSQGKARCYFTTTKAEVKTVRMLKPIALSGNSITFVHGPPDAGQSLISAIGPVVADNVTLANVIITLLDAFQNPVDNLTPTFLATDTGVTNSYGACTPSDVLGVSLCTLTATKAEEKSLTITSPVLKTGGSVSFVAGPADPAQSGINGTGPILSDGIHPSTVTIILQDSYLNPLIGTIPTFSATGVGNFYDLCTPTTTLGSSTCIFRSTGVGLKTLSIETPIVNPDGSVLVRTDVAPVASVFTPAVFNEDIQSIITLPYSDADGDLATACSIINPGNVTVTQACACDASGTCTVGVTGVANYFGAASFDYTVFAFVANSNVGTANLTINSVDDPPVAINITPANFNEDTQSIISILYTDVEFDQAVTCTLSNLTNVTETQACSCTLGMCSVGVTGIANYYGVGSFNFEVAANGSSSNIALANFTIDPVDDAPVAANLTPAALNEDIQSIITLSYTDVELDLATACTISGLTNVTVSQPCACTAGTCNVGITGNLNYNGAAAFNYTVLANGLTSAVASSTLSVTAVDDPPVAANFSPASFNEDTQEIITLSYSDVETDLATTCTLSTLVNVTQTQGCACAAGVCTVGVTGTADYYGAASFAFSVLAGGQTSNNGTSTLTIDPVDDAPVTANFTPAAFGEDIQSIITLPYSDVESDLATVCALSNVTNVTVTQTCACAAGVCTVGVTGLLDYFGAGSFDYSVVAGLSSNTSSASFTINSIDDAPIAANLTPVAFNEDVQSLITLSYTDVESDLATTCNLTTLSNVTVTQACACAAGVCTVGVTSTLNYNGVGGFDYTVTANGLTSVSANSVLSITAVDDAPVASNMTPAAFNEDIQQIITLTYSDVESDAAVSCALSSLSNVTETQACACAAGLCTVGVTGTLNYNGVAGFDFNVTANGLVSANASATLAISPVDDAPVSANITPVAFNEDLQSIITLSYADVDGDLATTCSLSNLSNVTQTQACACAAGACTVGVTGTLDYNGAGNFDYTVTANTQLSNVSSSTFSITPVDDAPVSANITPAAFNEDTQQIITLSYLDVEGDLGATCALSALNNVNQTQACACAAGVCTVGITGLLNFNGAANFAYTITANGLVSNSSTATLAVTSVDDAPVATNITPVAFNEDVQSIMTLAYSDVDGDQGTTCSVSNLSGVSQTQLCNCALGVCTVGVTGSPLNFNGAASFDFTVTANGLSTNVASSAFTVTAVDDTPVAANITPANFNEDVQSVITLSYLDVEGDAATACNLASVNNVTVTQACACAAGICTVGVTGTPLNFNGAAGFTYNVTANGLTSVNASATLTIDPVNDVPTVANFSPAAFDEDLQSIITLSYVDVDADAATSCTLSNLTNVTQSQACACAAGVCTVGVTGSPLNYNGSGSFDFTVTAAGQTSTAATASLTLSPVNDVPVAANISPAAFNEDTQQIITLSYVDVDLDNAVSCTLSNLSNITQSQACACAAGVCTVGVTGLLNYNGAAAFDYTVTAAGQTSTAAAATLSISAVNDIPVAINLTPAAFDEDVQSIITLSYTDIEGDTASSCSLTTLTNVSVTQACSCLFGVCTVGVTGTPLNQNGIASFNYNVTAAGQTSMDATASLTMSPVDDVPVAANISPANFNEDTQSIITLSYSDVEGNLAASCTLSALNNVTQTQACACAAGVCTVGVTGSPLNFNGAGSFNYTVTANGLTSAAASASFTIDAVNDAPVAANITPAPFNEDVQSILTLSYTDVEADPATSCAVSGLANVTQTQTCACAAGVCTVGVTGVLNFYGLDSFTYTVTAAGQTSVAATASLSILPVDDAPVAANFSAPAFDEDIQSIITLSYSDQESDAATSCLISNLSNVTLTQACACAAGVCTVGVTGSPLNFNGAASFDFSVTANGLTSAVATSTLTVNPVNDVPVTANITPAAFNEDVQSVITLSYSDVDLDLATSCSVSGLTNITQTQGCACAAGVCTVGVTGILNYNGAAGFNFTVTANSQTSAASSATLTISPVADVPVAANISPASFVEDTQEIITLSYSDVDNDLASTCALSNLGSVTVTQGCACTLGTCTVGITGTSHYNGSASFDYTVTANGDPSNTASASLSILPFDDAPVASNITPAAFNEDLQGIITLSYSDVEADLASTCSVAAPSNITITQACACAAGVCTVGVTGTPLNYNGVASFTYTVTANTKVSNSSTASLTITPVNDAPVSIAIAPANFNEDSQSIITLSYSDVDGDLATSCAPSALANVTVTQACACAAGSCTIGVTPTLNYNGSASFNFTVTAAGLTSTAATASLTVDPVNDIPVAANITPSAFNEDTQSVITLAYSDVDGDTASSCLVSNLTNVTQTQGCSCAAGICTVGVTGTPLNFNGAASFDFTVTANGQTSVAASAALTISAVDDNPVAINLTPAAFNEDVQSIINLSYTDVEGDQATTCTVSNLSNATVTQACSCLLGSCSVGVTGNPLNYNGIASFDYTVTATGLTSNTATSSLTISAVDDVPVANNITPAAFDEDLQSVVTLSYSDVESDLASSCAVTSVSNVTVTQGCACAAGTCTVGVTGSPLNYNGPANFTYTVTSNGLTSVAATASLTVSPVNDAPVAANIAPASFNEDLQGLITLSYTDLEGDLATACTLSGLTNVTQTQSCACAAGTCTVGVTGTPLNYNGAASFNYTVTATGQTSAAAAATLTIDAVNDAPVVASITPAAFNEDTQGIITLSYSDVDGDSATVCAVSGLTNVTETQVCACAAGVCTVGVTGSPLNYNGAASFNYTVTAAGQLSNSTSATLSITPVNDTPIAANITPVAFNEDVQSIITLSYNDVDGDSATSCSLAALTNVSQTQACACAAGICTVGVTGSPLNFNGAASFTYTVTATGQTSAAATATLSISPVNDVPVVANISPASFNEDLQGLITLAYSDVDGDTATACAVTGLTNVTQTQGCACAAGICTVGVTGTPLNYNGSGSFNFTVTAAGQTSASALATLTIDPVNDVPVAANITPAAFNEDVQNIITLSYSDVDGDTAVSCVVSGLSNVTETQVCACAAGVCTVGVTGTPLNYNGVANFNYTVTANSQTSAAATANLTINNVDDAPVAANITPAAFNEDAQSIITLSYSDVEGDLAVSCTPSNLSNVTVTQGCVCAAGTCTVGVTGSPVNYFGAASFDYTVTANGQASTAASAALTIINVNDAPVTANISPASFNEDVQSIITLSYTDPELDLASTCTIASVSSVTVTQACACAAGVCTVGVTGTPLNYNGTANFTYTVTANTQTSNTSTATLTVDPVNDVPVAANITPAAFNEDVQSIITLSYSDVDGDLATACTPSALTNVTVTQACACAAGTCTVGVTGSPLNYNGAASFNYTVTANGQTSAAVAATLSITAVNDTPVAINLTPAAFNEDVQSVITLTYTDAEGDLAAACSLSTLSNVTVTQACACAVGTCTVGVTGSPLNYNGIASFSYNVTAGGQTSANATASLTVSAVDDAPVAVALTPAAFNEDTQQIITLNYSDVDGDLATACTPSALTNVTVTQTCACAAGTCTVGVTGSPLNYNGAASFNYTVTANGQTSAAVAATLSITNVNDAPVAAAISPAAFNEDTQAIITLSYSDADSDLATACTPSALTNVTVTQACACAAGTCTVGVTGSPLNYNGAASFNYTVTANGQTSAAVAATLSITAVNDAPVAVALTPAAFNENTQEIINLSYSDVDGDLATACTPSALTNVTVTQACACAAGTCTVGVTGSPLNYYGAASFNYTVTANGQTSAVVAATLSINNVDNAPVAAAISPAAFNEDTQAIITLSYSDADSDLATACTPSALANVTVTQACACAAGTCTVGVTGSPLNYNGAASLNYTVTANGQSSAAVAATLSITNVNDAPVAAAISPAAFNEDTQQIITLSYSDVDGDLAIACTPSALTNVTVTQACACAAGTCTVGVTGSPLNFNGAASFNYTVTANSQTSAAVAATLSITNVNDAPVAVALTPAAFNEDIQQIITLSYSDVDGDLASACAPSALTNVTVTQACACAAGTCTVGVTGSPLNYNGAASFNYTVTANSQTSAAVAATLSITNVNDAPVAAVISPAAFNEDTQQIITLSYSDVEGDLATACTPSALTNVTVTQACACAAGTCTVGVTGSPLNYNGAASFNYTVTANGQTSTAATATLSITNVNDAPVAVALTPAAFNEDTQEIINLSYSDVDGDIATACTPSNLTNVTVTQACACAVGACSIGVTGSPLNYNGTASFDYTITANAQTSTAVAATLSITNVNDAPVAAAISPAAFNEDTQQIITLSYSDVEGDLASACTPSALANVSVTQACACAAGTCTVGVTGSPLNYNGAASFNYTVTANSQTSAAVAATLSITNVNDAPVAAAISPAAFNEDTQQIITLSYSDVDSDLATSCTPSNLSNITVTQACACAAGTCTMGVTGSPLNFNGAASFDYTVTANGQTSAVVAATLAITNVNDAPVAAAISPAAFNEDTQQIITLSYSDVDGDLAIACTPSALTNVTVTQACACAAGTCTVGVTGSPLNYNGAASFNYTVTANAQTSAAVAATLAITNVNDAPVAAAISPAAFNEDTQQIITLSYSDVDGDLATACAPSALTNVTVTQACACAAGTCTVGVTGSPLNYNGAASFDYTVTANGQTSAAVAATLAITNVNDAPVAVALTPAAFNEDTQQIITLSYSDVDGDLATACTPSALTNVTVTQACACAAGTCTVGVTGSPLNYNGAASFNYTVTANAQTSAAVAATLSITNVNDAPVAAAISPAAFNEDTQQIITLSYSDVDGDLASACTPSALTNVTVTQACACATGTCTVGVTGSPLNYNGAASFNYTVTANSQTSAAVAATLSITNVNDAPVAAAISPAAFNEDTQQIITLSYSDVDSDLATSCTPSNLSNITVTQACACAAGTCTVGVTGSPLNFNGAASFDYTVTANGQTSAVVAATLAITNVNDAPVAVALTPAAFNEDTQQIITLSYSDVEGDLATACTPSVLTNVTVTQACACAAGTCTVGVTGSPLNYNGAASFNYTVTANSQTSAAVAATLSITNVNDAPVAAAISPAAFNEDTQQIITLSYSDVDGDLAIACTPSALTNVTVTQACACAAGTCTVGVTGSPLNYNGAASFDYTVTANGQTSAAVAATLSITNVNDAPVAAAISPAAFNEDTQQIITLSYSDVDGDLAIACTPSALTNVTVTQACACAAGTCTVGVTGSPLNYNGAASFNYTVTANAQTSAAVAATLSITNVNDAPVAAAISPAAFNEDTQQIITLSYSDVDGDLAIACTPSALANVTVTQACACATGTCTVGVTGSPLNYSGAASFNYTVTANGQTSAAVAATLSITNVNDAPVAAAISPAAFNEDTQQIITLSYSDVDGDLATACTPSALINVTVTQACACAAGACTVGVTGSPLNYNGAASFNYTVTANGQTSAAVAATLSITNVNDAPVAAAISPAAFNEDTQEIITLSYSDVDGDLAIACTPSALTNVTVTQACACAAGACTVGVTGSPLNYNGAASFDYTVTANGQTSAAVAATLSITNVNDAPVAAAISPAAFNEDTQQIITLSYSDVDGDLAIACTPSALTNVTVTQACACAAGACTVGITGSPLNYNGAASFNYTVTANGQTSAAVAATLSITNVNDAPVAAAISPAAFNEDTQEIITLSYSDVDGDLAIACTPSALTNVTVTQACACAAGTCTVGVTGSPLNYNGAASFNYTVTANAQTSAAAAATLSITAVNDIPVAINLTPAAFNEDVQSVITLTYTDIEGDVATACSLSALTNVTVTQACACTLGTCTVGVTGSPLNYNGIASFDYNVTAGGQTSANATASLTVSAVDDAPVAAAISPAAFNEDTQSIINLSYSDVELHSATTCSIPTVNNVTVTQACACTAGACTVGVTGLGDYNGAASFTYTVTANGLTSAAATATLSITNVNDVPVAANISPPAFNEDVQSIITLSYTDADSDLAGACAITGQTNVTVTQACACAAGTCTVGVTGSPVSYNGAADFTYTVTANTQTSIAKMATLFITGVDDAPVVAAFTPATFAEDTQSLDITLAYTDAESHLATSCSITSLNNVTVTQACACAAGNCTVRVTGTANYNGAASFAYSVVANGLSSAAAAATFTISAVDDVPSTASFTAASFNEDIQSVITLSYVDVDNDLASACTVSTLSGVSVTQACACTAGGVCTVGVTGSPVNFFGAVSFDYTITAAGQTSTPVRTVSSTILSVNDAPTMALIPASSTVKNTQSAAITVSTGDVDHPAMTCTNTYLSMSSDNTAKVLNSSVVWAGTWPNCTAQVTPVTNATGTINLTFTVIDPLGATASRTFAFSINGAHMVIVLGGVIVTSYDFGNPTGNISQAFTVRNDGNQASSVLGAVVNGGPNFQMGFDNCGAVAVAAGGSCTATVDWRENVGGATPANKTGDLTITYTLGTAVLTTTAIK